MRRRAIRSPNVVLVRLPACDDTSDQIIRDIVEGQPDATRRRLPSEEAA